MLDLAVLDNVVWHATQGEQRDLAETSGTAARFSEDVAPFAGIADPAARSSWTDLGDLIGAGKAAVLFVPSIDVPDGWTKEMSIPCLQMVATEVDRTPQRSFVELGPPTSPDMLALVDATRPGPFAGARSSSGRYVGHPGRRTARRDDGRAIEVSRLHRGQRRVHRREPSGDRASHGSSSSRSIAAHPRAGDEAFLHVETDNTPAIGLYESIGFTVRVRS